MSIQLTKTRQNRKPSPEHLLLWFKVLCICSKNIERNFFLLRKKVRKRVIYFLQVSTKFLPLIFLSFSKQKTATGTTAYCGRNVTIPSIGAEFYYAHVVLQRRCLIIIRMGRNNPLHECDFLLKTMFILCFIILRN